MVCEVGPITEILFRYKIENFQIYVKTSQGKHVGTRCQDQSKE